MAEQRIGKYRILERIGRGGMGTIFKAHDPMLDRLVAVKVISAEVEVTDELRARFFREAQAYAKLNHPNIVTIHDLGEDEGRLFIVMELLEGEELRRLIAQRTPVTLEDKLSIMVQACAGLHYAHEKKIFHRDIKPGNLFLLPNGHVKILDFGIARVATGDGLTRTGLIIGTLRYISPEQVRGRVDRRSDMFSLGAVFYELLALRMAFTADDPMELLDQLRREDPPPLHEVDPSIPPVLTRIVQRAMHKNPEERFHDLDEMRIELEQVRLEMQDERRRVAARVRGQRERLVQVQAAAAERLSPSGSETAIPGIDESRGLAAIVALERELADRIAALEANIAQAEALAPVVERAEALVEAGRYEEAFMQFEAILAQLPGHRAAWAGLERVRAEADRERRRRRGAELREKAQAALNERRYELCAEILEEAAQLGLPSDLADELDSLHERAVAGQEALRRAREEAEEAAGQSAAARATAQAEEASRYAPDQWREAQALAGAAETSLQHGAHTEAKEGFERARAAYQAVLEAARRAQVEERRTADRAREAAILEQQRARAAGAEQYARGSWDAGERKLAEAQAAFSRKASGFGTAPFNEASGLYRQAEEIARATREQERGRAEAARDRADEGRRNAAAFDAERWAPSIWQEAVGRSTAGEAAWLQGQYVKAAEAFEAALSLYHKTQVQVREAARHQREESARKRGDVATVEAAADASTGWAEAAAAAAAAVEASPYAPEPLNAAANAEARMFARDDATIVVPVSPAPDPTILTPPGVRVERTPQPAPRPGLKEVAAWLSTRTRWPVTVRHLLIGVGGIAAMAVLAVMWRSQTATQPVVPAVSSHESPKPPSPAPVHRLAAQVASAREEAIKADAEKLAGTTFLVAGLKAQAAAMAHQQGDAATAEQQYQAAVAGYRLAKMQAEGTTAMVADTAKAERSTADARLAADRAGAPMLATSFWSKGAIAQARAEEAIKQRAFDRALALFGEALRAYEDARRAAEDASRPARAPIIAAKEPPRVSAQPLDTAKDREAAEEAGRVSVAIRHEAEGAKAPSLAAQTFAMAVGKQGEGEAALKAQQFASAKQRFLEAHEGFKRAALEAQTAAATLLARAEEARSGMLAARRETDQAAASQYPAAAKLFASAQAKERESESAFSRAEHAAAARLFGEARAEYQTVGREANRQKELAALAQQIAEQSRARMGVRRDEALKADAGRFAKSIFDAAEKRRAEADALAARQSFSDAGHGYQDAAELYLQAKIRADDVGKQAKTRADDVNKAKALADSGKAQMLEAKGRAKRGTQYKQAENEEREANVLYEGASYVEAEEKYRKAKKLYEAAKESPPPPPGFSG